MEQMYNGDDTQITEAQAKTVLDKIYDSANNDNDCYLTEVEAKVLAIMFDNLRFKLGE